MRSFRLLALVLFVIVVVGATAVSAQQRSVGQVIDDATITTEVKAKLTADALANLGTVDNIQVRGAYVPPATSPIPETPAYDVVGVVSQVDPATRIIILQDGRVLRMTGDTQVWQLTTIHSLRPGTQVLVRAAEPLGLGQASSNTYPAPAGAAR